MCDIADEAFDREEWERELACTEKKGERHEQRIRSTHYS